MGNSVKNAIGGHNNSFFHARFAAIVVIILFGVFVQGTFAATAASASMESPPPPEVEYNPEFRQTSLFVANSDALSSSITGGEQSSSHNFPIGSFSNPSDGPIMSTEQFVRNTSIGGEDWQFSLWVSGSGSVDIDLSVMIDGNEIDQVNSGDFTLSASKSQVTFSGMELPEIINNESVISLQWTVNSNAFPGTSSNCEAFWGTAEVPSNFSFSAAMIQVDAPYLVSKGVSVTSDQSDYARENVEWAAQVRWGLDESQINFSTYELYVTEGEHFRSFSVESSESYSYESTILYWKIDVEHGEQLSANVMFNDTSGNQYQSGQSTELFVGDGPSLLGSGTIAILYLLTLPALIVVGIWLRKRYYSLVDAAEELGHGPKNISDLPKMLTIGAFLVMGIANAMVLYSFHSRKLGASEDLVLLHGGLLILTYGISGPLWGALADRIGRRKQILGISLTGAAAVMLAFPWAPLELFIPLTLIQTTLFGSSRIAFAVGTEWFPEHKGEFIGMLYAVSSLFAAASSMANGWLYKYLLDSNGVSSAMLGAITLSIPMLAIAAYLVRHLEGEEFTLPIWQIKGEEGPTPRGEGTGRLSAMMSALRELFTFESKWPKFVMAGVLLVAIPRGAVVLTTLRYLEIVGFDIDFSGLLEAWAVLAVLVLYAVIGKICDSIGAQNVLLWSALAYGTLWSIYSIGLPPFLAVFIFVIPVYPMLLVSNDSLLARFTTEKERNRGMGVAGAVALAGQAVGIAIGYVLMNGFLGKGMSELDAYHMTYRVNILFWVIAVAGTWWLAKTISNNASDSSDAS